MAGFALSVVVGVLFASLSTLFAGFGALFGDSSQQGGVLGGEVVGRIAQCQHLVNGFGAGFHGFVAGGKLVDAVVEADAASSKTGSGSFEQVFVNFAGGSSGERERGCVLRQRRSRRQRGRGWRQRRR